LRRADRQPGPRDGSEADEAHAAGDTDETPASAAMIASSTRLFQASRRPPSFD